MRSSQRRQMWVLGVLALSCGSTTADAGFLSVGVNVTGNGLPDGRALTSSTFAPPDTDGSIGPSHYVQFTNGEFAVYSKATGALVTPRLRDRTFWNNAGISTAITSAGLSDPRIIYDPASQRWFAAEINTANSSNIVLVARSNDSDPTHGFQAAFYTGSSGFADFPTLGVNADGLFVATNNFNSATGVTLTSIPKSDLLLSTPTVANRSTFVDPSYAMGFALQPAIDFGPSNGHASIIAANLSNNGRLNRTNVFNVAGPGAATLSATGMITVASINSPIDAHQPDGTQSLDGSDTRFASAAYKVGNVIYAVRGTTTAGHDGIRWYKMDESSGAIIQTGTIADPNFDYIYPSIAANAVGDIVIGFTRTGANSDALGPGFASAVAIVGSVNSSNSVVFGDPIMLKAGTDNYHLFHASSGERWGDYSATGVDPSDPTSFWTTQEWADTSNNWRTQITQIRVAVGNTSWNIDADGDWSPPLNWTAGSPNNADATANFGVIITAPRTVSVDSPKTVGTLNFSSPIAYTIGGGSTLTLDSSSGSVGINVTAGSHSILAPLALNQDLTVNTAGSTGVSIAGSVSAAGHNITKLGNGTAQFANVRTGGLNVTAGAVQISANPSHNSPAGTSVIAALQINPGASLDLANNSAVIDYSGLVGTLVDDTRQMLSDGRLTSSSADATHRLGYADNAASGLAIFSGQSVDSSSILIKFTFGGDANLDGQVDVADLGAVATNWQTSNIWTGGDFNYDGFVDVTDLGILAGDWQLGVGSPLGPTLAEALAALGLGGVSVPEPATVGAILAMSLAAGVVRPGRRRRC